MGYGDSISSVIQVLPDDTSKYQQQVDFVEIIKSRVGFNRFRLKRLTATQPEVVFDDGTKHVTYRFNKDPNDDFYKLNKVFVGDVGDLVISEKDIQAADITGTWNATSMTGNNWYTTQVGATFSGTVTGETIKLTSYTDDRGGIWEFVVDGDTANKATLTTWSSVATSSVQQVIKSGLANTSHTIVATFKGDDPAHAPSSGAGTGRGWAYVNTSLAGFATLLGCIKASNPESKRLLIDGSNKEFAFSITYNGVTNWFPEHNGVGTAFKIDDIQFLVDNVPKDFNALADGAYVDFKSSLVINQHLYCVFSGTNIAEVWISHYFNRDGAVKWTGKLKVLQAFKVEYGYPLMLPIANENFTEVTTGLYNNRVSDFGGTVYNFDEERDFVRSCVAVDAITRILSSPAKSRTQSRRCAQKKQQENHRQPSRFICLSGLISRNCTTFRMKART